MDNDLCVATASEYMSELNQLVMQFTKIINLTVIDKPDVATFIGHWLVATLDVDDTQTSVSETVIGCSSLTLVVGATMPDYVSHLPYLGNIAVTDTAGSDQSRYSTHVSSPSMT